MHSLPVLSQARQVVPTPLLTHLTLLRRHLAHAIEDRIRGFSERRDPVPSPACAAASKRCAAVCTEAGDEGDGSDCDVVARPASGTECDTAVNEGVGLVWRVDVSGAEEEILAVVQFDGAR